MQILMDTREKKSLTFQMVDGVEVKSECLNAGDYGCRHGDGSMDSTVIERKGLGDLFSSFSNEKKYSNEKAKIKRAKEAGLHYVLAIESPALEVLKGYTYVKGGKVVTHNKSGIAMVRQIMTIERKYGIQVWWCQNRTDMAFRIQEYFLAKKRMMERDRKIKARGK